MALPKGKLMALLAVFAAIGIITATGAFTSVTADRTAKVEVTGDQAANLQLVPFDGPNGWNGGGTDSGSNGYADIQNGVLVINLAGFNNGNAQSAGVNYDAVTVYENVFNLTNNANETVGVTITPEGNFSDRIVVEVTDDDGVKIKDSSGDTNMSADTFDVTEGETNTISLTVNTTDLNNNNIAEGESLIDSFSITASQNDANTGGETQ